VPTSPFERPLLGLARYEPVTDPVLNQRFGTVCELTANTSALIGPGRGDRGIRSCLCSPDRIRTRAHGLESAIPVWFNVVGYRWKPLFSQGRHRVSSLAALAGFERRVAHVLPSGDQHSPSRIPTEKSETWSSLLLVAATVLIREG
jgi:hypothetical protein